MTSVLAQVWTVQAVSRDPYRGGHRIGIFTSEDAAIDCARRQQAAYDADVWDVRLEGPRDWTGTI